jgi:hypothetical protein
MPVAYSAAEQLADSSQRLGASEVGSIGQAKPPLGIEVP